MRQFRIGLTKGLFSIIGRHDNDQFFPENHRSSFFAPSARRYCFTEYTRIVPPLFIRDSTRESATERGRYIGLRSRVNKRSLFRAAANSVRRNSGFLNRL